MLTSESMRPDTAMTKIQVTRAFSIKGQPLKVGDVVEVTASLAVELVHMNKAIKVDATAAQQPANPAQATPAQAEPEAKSTPAPTGSTTTRTTRKEQSK